MSENLGTLRYPLSKCTAMILIKLDRCHTPAHYFAELFPFFLLCLYFLMFMSSFFLKNHISILCGPGAKGWYFKSHYPTILHSKHYLWPELHFNFFTTVCFYSCLTLQEFLNFNEPIHYETILGKQIMSND